MDDRAIQELRSAARDALLHRKSASIALPESQLASIAIPDDLSCLKEYISSQKDASNTEVSGTGPCVSLRCKNHPLTISQICENLLFALAFLKPWCSRGLSEQDKESVDYLFDWASNAALPSPVFAEIRELDGETVLAHPSFFLPSANTKTERRDLVEGDQLRSNIAVSVIELLALLLPIHEAANTPNIVIALASFTSDQDPWTLPETHARANALLTAQFTPLRLESNSTGSFWVTIETILKQKIRPLFAKTKNPAITASGRKNFHPVPLPRFDASALDPETKPWKFQDVYATTVLSWIINQYQVRPHPALSSAEDN